MSSKNKHKSRRSERSNYYPTSWSEWQWSEEHQCNTRYREVAEGDWEWGYDQVQSTTSTHQSGKNVPRRTPSVVLSSPQPQEEEQLADTSENYTHDDGTFGITQSLAGASIRSHSSDHRSSEEYRDPRKGDSNHLRYSSSQAGTSSGQQYYPASQAGTSSGQQYFPASQAGTSSGQQYYPASQAETSSGQQYYPASQASTDIYGGHPASQSTRIQDFGHGQQYTTAGVWGAGASSYESPSGSSSVPPILDNTTRKIRTRNPGRSHDELDRRFKVHRSTDFKFGKVFKVLWSEPVGAGGTEITQDARAAKHGENAFHKVRRFLITSTSNRGHSICIPILTYGFQGVLKPGVHPEDHAVVYSSKRDGPYLLEREEGLMSKSPIRIEVTSESNKLDPLSRLNYAKLYTVEHNVKVFFIGQVAKKYERPLIIAYNEAHPPLDPGPQDHLGSSEDLTSFAEQADPSWPAPLTEEEGEDDPSYHDGYDQ